MQRIVLTHLAYGGNINTETERFSREYKLMDVANTDSLKYEEIKECKNIN